MPIWIRFALAAALVWCAACGGERSDESTSPTAATANPCGGSGPDAECHTLVSGGVTRAYLLHVPARFQPNVGALVIGLHGSRGSGSAFAQNSQLSVKADQEGFAVAYPSSLVSPGAGFTEWNEFFNHSFGDAPPDDVGFIRDLARTLLRDVRADPRRVYVAGLSNGGFMAHRVGVELSDMVAAVAVVEGTVVSPGLVRDVPPALGPVSVLMLHGDLDPTVLYCGGPAVASQEESFDYWAGPAGNDCRVLDTTAPLCDAQRNITGLTTRLATGCRGNAEVRFFRLQGGVHTWYQVPLNVPGQLPFNPDLAPATGITTNDILWRFFAAHSKP